MDLLRLRTFVKIDEEVACSETENCVACIETENCVPYRETEIAWQRRQSALGLGEFDAMVWSVGFLSRGSRLLLIAALALTLNLPRH